MFPSQNAAGVYEPLFIDIGFLLGVLAARKAVTKGLGVC
jgi:hypothetical protein